MINASSPASATPRRKGRIVLFLLLALAALPLAYVAYSQVKTTIIVDYPADLAGKQAPRDDDSFLSTDALPAPPPPAPPIAAAPDRPSALPARQMRALEERVARLEEETRRIPLLEEELRALRERSAAAPESLASSPRAALLVAFYRLERRVVDGERFDEQLDVLLRNPLLPPAAHIRLAALAAHADGVPAERALAEGFGEALETYEAAGLATGGGLSGRMKAGLARLVTIRKIGEAEQGTGDDARIARAERAVTKGDFAQAAAEIAALSPEARAPFAAWEERARLRGETLAGLSAARDLLFAAVAEEPLP